MKHRNPDVKAYLKELRRVLLCSAAMKKVVLEEIRQKIDEIPSPTRAILYQEIGDPKEIARGFETREDDEVIREKAARYSRIRKICILVAILATVAILISTLAIIVIHDSNNSKGGYLVVHSSEGEDYTYYFDE